MTGSKRLISVGIDIGTTTLQVVFSQLVLDNEAPSYLLPKIVISSKEVIYKSSVYFTPKLSKTLLDMAKIKFILAQEYQTAGYKKEDIGSGAIILTGEAANKENADLAAAKLAEFAGDFVVAVAGSDLESVLAGRGSGTAALTKIKGCTLANLDIGGGTTNVAVFQAGNLLDAYGLHVGGRLICFDSEFKITYCSSKISCLLSSVGIKLTLGERADFKKLAKICYLMAESLAKAVMGEKLSLEEQGLQIYHGSKSIALDGCTISGGVGALLYATEIKSLADLAVYGDLGPLLAQCVKQVFEARQIKLLQPKETIRATVIGAGLYTMQLSGSTVSFDLKLLPLKNVPLVRIEVPDENDFTGLADLMAEKAAVYRGMLAFSFKGMCSPKYSAVKSLGKELALFYVEKTDPILIVLEEDMGKILGQVLHGLLKKGRQIICLDGLKGHDGDYIDFCQPVSGSMLVVIKTLLFKN